MVPVICRLLPTAQLKLPDDQQRACPWSPELAVQGAEPVKDALLGWVKNLGSDFWYIFKLTVPLMFLAGFLGAVAATLVPIETFSTLGFGLIGLFGVALLGLFLPVPIAFDVVICTALLAAGVPPGYVMALLFTLGIFSIYSGFIRGNDDFIACRLIYVGDRASNWHLVWPCCANLA